MTENNSSQSAKNAPHKSEDQKAEDPPLNAKEELSEFFKTAMIALIIAVLIRTFLYEPFNIPSGSMKPTLDVGDYLFVHKPAYGYSQYSFPFGAIPVEGRVWGDDLPERGDVVVFWNLKTNQNYIKRLIGLPGDRIQVRRGRLYINGTIVEREVAGFKTLPHEYNQNESVFINEYIETLPGGAVYNIYEVSDDGPLDNTEEFSVPEGHYFMMGDNRDNSQDSRVAEAVGFVPLEAIKGRADMIFFSSNGYAHLYEVWKWPWSIRYDRIGQGIDPLRPADDKE